MKNICFFITSYGSHQNDYLYKLLDTINSYKKYKCTVFLFTTNDLDTSNYTNLELTTLKYPENIQLNLAFQHKLFLKENFEVLKNEFDIFIGLENDILLNEHSVEYFEKYQAKVDPQKYVIGTLRYEIKDDVKYYTDTGGKTIEELFEYVLSVDDKKFYKTKHNPHSGMFMFLTEQIESILKQNINFTPEQDLESSISNFYKGPWPGSPNGIEKLVCFEDLEHIDVHHLPNKYVNDAVWMDRYKPKTEIELKNYFLKTLVILIGNARGGEIAWHSMYENLLKPYNADLALCFGKNDNKSSSLYEIAKYIWEMPEYKDWSDYYKEVCSQNWKASFLAGSWIGLAGGIEKNTGSGSIIFAFRHFIKNNFLDILNQYDRIILTRSDHLYIRQHPILSNNFVWIVEGEDYGGITDRHHIFPSKYSKEVLGIVEYMDLKTTAEKIKKLENPNPESVLLDLYTTNGIKEKIKRCERVQFTVATETDTTRWQGKVAPVPGISNLWIKYPEEYKTAIQNIKNLINAS